MKMKYLLIFASSGLCLIVFVVLHTKWKLPFIGFTWHMRSVVFVVLILPFNTLFFHTKKIPKLLQQYFII